MIRHITCREVRQNLLSLRFALFVLLTTALFIICGYAFGNEYREQSRYYWKKTNENLAALRAETEALYRVAFYHQQVYRQPQPLSLCAEGFEQSLPNFYQVNAFTAELPETRGQANFALPHFSHVDWVLIISLVLSFAALVLTYDSFCGEKQAGTLRLTLANTIPRYQALLGKYLGAMFTLTLPLFIGMLVSLIIVIPSEDIAFGGSDWLKILTIALISLLYLSLFVLLGLFVSSRVTRPANAMAILLLAWVVAIILVPSFCRIIFDITYAEPTEEELVTRLREVGDEIWDNSDRYGERAGYMSHNRDDPGNNPPARARLRNAIVEAQNQVREDHHNQWLGQALARRNFARLSPAVVYQRACEVIAGTGIGHCAYLYEQVKRYGADMREFIRSRDLEDPESLHLPNPEIGTARSWRAISHDPVDFGIVPKFQEHAETWGRSLQQAIWDIGLLILFNLVFFAAAFVSFIRYDVR